MKAKPIIVGCLIAATLASPGLAQRKFIGGPSIKLSIPDNIRHLIQGPKAFQLITLKAECEVIKVSKTAWKPPYYNYRTGGIAFRMGGNGNPAHYVAIYGTSTQVAPNVPQPDRSETFAAGKLTTGAFYDDPQSGIVLAIEADNQKQANVVHVPVAAGSGSLGTLIEIEDGNGQSTGFYRWMNSSNLTCQAGYV